MKMNKYEGATTLAEVMHKLGTQAPDTVTQVVLNARHPLGGQVLAIAPGAPVGSFDVVTPSGALVRVKYHEVVAQCARCANPQYGEALNWSPRGLAGAGFHPTHAEAVAALAGLAADAVKRTEATNNRVVRY